eukprot:RCo028137
MFSMCVFLMVPTPLQFFAEPNGPPEPPSTATMMQPILETTRSTTRTLRFLHFSRFLKVPFKCRMDPHSLVLQTRSFPPLTLYIPTLSYPSCLLYSLLIGCPLQTLCISPCVLRHSYLNDCESNFLLYAFPESR